LTKSTNREQRKKYDVERRDAFRILRERLYKVGRNQSLSDVSLERGDTLPDDASYEIIKATEQVAEGGLARVVRVIGLKEQIEASGTPWSELKGTRQVFDQYPHYIEYVITFTGAPASARPNSGDTYSDVTGSGSLSSANLTREPVAVHVGQMYRVTVNKSHVTIRFRGRYAQSK